MNDENLNVDSDLDDSIENDNATVAIEDDGLVLMNSVLSCHDASSLFSSRAWEMYTHTHVYIYTHIYVIYMYMYVCMHVQMQKGEKSLARY